MERNYETEIISGEIQDLLETVNKFMFDYEEFALIAKKSMLALSNDN